MTINPFEPPAEIEQKSHSVLAYIGITVCVVMAALHAAGVALLLVSAILMPGKLTPGLDVSMVFLALFYIVIVVGLILCQEWARVSFLFFCYTSLFFAFFYPIELAIPAVLFEVFSLSFAHLPAVKRLTKGVSIPDSYVYQEFPKVDEQ